MGKQITDIDAGWLIDGSGNAVQRRMRISLQNGMIRSIRKHTAHRPDGAEGRGSILDLSDCTVLPGLVDCHVHLALPRSPARDHEADATMVDDHRGRKQILKRLDQYLALGVMAVRDGGDPAGCVLQSMADPEIKDHAVQIRAAAIAYFRPGRYGHLIGQPLLADLSLAKRILEAPKAGSHIKIVNSGLNSLSVFGKQTATQFDSDELKAAVRAARQRGLKTMIHANGETAVRTALDAGCDSIEHGFFMGADNMRRMADSQTVWVPTVFTMQALKQRMKSNGQAVDVVHKNLDHQIKQIQRAGELGVRIVMGTDSGSPGVDHGRAVVDEMRLLLNAGYPIEAVVACATRNGAGLIGWPLSGQVKINMQANLIAARGNPGQLPQSLKKIKAILCNGNIIKLDGNGFNI